MQKLRLFLGTGLLGGGILFGIVNAVIGLPGLLSDLQSWGRWMTAIHLQAWGPWVLGAVGLALVLWAIVDPSAKVPNRSMGFGEMVRYIARESKWAEKNPLPTDDWMVRLQHEIMERLCLGDVLMVGVQRSNSSVHSGPSPVSPEFWRVARYSIYNDIHPPFQPNAVKSYNDTGSYEEIRVDPRDVRKVWPRRSWLAAWRRQSPVELHEWDKKWAGLPSDLHKDPER